MPPPTDLADKHRDALRAFLNTARGIPPQRWNTPLAPGKWSPAQVAEHVRLTYGMADTELTSGVGIRVRSSPWLRPLIRLVFLPRILRTGMLPKGARAPREIRPGDGPFDQRETLGGLEAIASAFQAKLASHEGRGLTHHVFGQMDKAKTWQILAVHTEHHRRQIAGANS
jgi:hypothetical protein